MRVNGLFWGVPFSDRRENLFDFGPSKGIEDTGQTLFDKKNSRNYPKFQLKGTCFN